MSETTQNVPDASLGNIGKFASTFSERSSLSRFTVLHKLRHARGFIHQKHEVFGCHVFKIPSYRTDRKTGKMLENKGVPDNIQIHKYVKGEEQDSAKHALVGVKKCGSAMVCPVCGSLIRSARQKELIQIGQRLMENGYSYFFVTYTASHSIGTSLEDFVLRFQAAQHDFKSGRKWQNMKKRYGIRWEARTVEVTDDNPLYTGMAKKTGFHFHSHSVMWSEKPIEDAEKDALRVDLQKLWVKACVGVGLHASAENGCTVEYPRTRYGDVADIAPLAQYLSKKISYEMTSDIYKDGRLSRRISIWEVLRLSAEIGNKKLWARWGQYMQGIKKVHFLHLTPGLRAFCGLDEKTDEEILQGETAEQVYEFDKTGWSAVAHQGGQRKIIYIADHAHEDGETVENAVDKAVETALKKADILTGEILLE